MTDPTTEAGRALLKAYPDTTDGEVTRRIIAIEAEARAAGREEAVERIRRLANILEGPTPGSIWLPDLLAILDAPAEPAGHSDLGHRLAAAYRRGTIGAETPAEDDHD